MAAGDCVRANPHQSSTTSQNMVMTMGPRKIRHSVDSVHEYTDGLVVRSHWLSLFLALLDPLATIFCMIICVGYVTLSLLGLLAKIKV